MKRLIIILLGVILSFQGYSQSATAANKANFGVDGELKAAYLGALPQSVNFSHDWFSNLPIGPLGGVPIFIIDTTGAKFITDKYAVDPNFRKLPFFRLMRYPPFDTVSGRRLIDAIFIRDYHDQDSTVFTISNKNGDSPATWDGETIVGNIPQKNDILDMFVHVRRAGEGLTLADSLWFIGGVAIDVNSGSRYFDFELYQTDIFFNRTTGKFTGYGPDAGHTSWKFDATTGVVTTPGDVIFSAEFGGSGLAILEARIWVHQSALSINSPNFDWVGDFDGAGGIYGYANIRPKDNTQIFYSGLQNNLATWAGPFQLVRGNNTVQLTYDAKQFLEFSVNMTTLGLDPISLLGGGGACGMPFRRILVKTRASASFEAELKDFVGPFDFFTFEAADAAADLPMICGDEMISTISVLNPLPTSTYTWITPDGNIVGDTFGVSITVDTPGTYIVRQQLLAGCGQYAMDTVVITEDPICALLPHNRIQLSGSLKNTLVKLEFNVSSNENVKYYIIERSVDAKNYSIVKQLNNNGSTGYATYLTDDNISSLAGNQVHYRVKMVRLDGTVRYSDPLDLSRGSRPTGSFTISPNPVVDRMQLVIPSMSDNDLAVIKIFDAAGALMEMKRVTLRSGNNVIGFDGFDKWSSGIYPVQVQVGDLLMNQKMILTRRKP
ncbi:T9SS type A sorting domain-containing protein [Flavihumibacter sp. ZG627]|uniref:T9SS type A sorting domain-containing protein n=1 Tax=Flavihumibacter sp. ZG627 TaxID=1463156 RepID=UPI00057CD152|nr:T9SS type A sorting domain-containing protein [Flavihumibacter sp. ZG627]KIC91570.1 hypothetical protein HY58_04840 [Flavihumibacter sp. ZG627]